MTEHETAAAERRVRMLRLLDTASHDLRQPFQAVQLFHHLLLSRLPEGGAREMCEKLGEATQASEAMIRALLDVLQLEAGLVETARSDFAVDEVLGHLLEEFDDRVRAKGLRLVVRPAEAMVNSDPVLLMRLMRPLMDNALRFTRKGGILLGARRRGQALRIEVWDTGSGLADSDFRAIAQELSTGTSERRRGFGIAIAQRLAALLGHPMSVCTRPGKGTGFFVTVPLAAG